MNREELNRLSESVLACAYRVHSTVGPGLLESVYKSCLAIELRDAGLALAVEVEYPCPVVYRGQQVAEIGYRMDLLVEKVLVVEIKSVEAIHPVHLAQLMS